MHLPGDQLPIIQEEDTHNINDCDWADNPILSFRRFLIDGEQPGQDLKPDTVSITLDPDLDEALDDEDDEDDALESDRSDHNVQQHLQSIRWQVATQKLKKSVQKPSKRAGSPGPDPSTCGAYMSFY